MALDEIMGFVNGDTSETLDSMIKSIYNYSIESSNTVQKAIIERETLKKLSPSGNLRTGNFRTFTDGYLKIKITWKTNKTDPRISFQVVSGSTVLGTTENPGENYRDAYLTIKVTAGTLYELRYHSEFGFDVDVTCTNLTVCGTFIRLGGNNIVD